MKKISMDSGDKAVLGFIIVLIILFVIVTFESAPKRSSLEETKQELETSIMVDEIIFAVQLVDLIEEYEESIPGQKLSYGDEVWTYTPPMSLEGFLEFLKEKEEMPGDSADEMPGFNMGSNLGDASGRKHYNL